MSLVFKKLILMTNTKNSTDESNLSSSKKNDQKDDQFLKLLSTQLHDQFFLVELKPKDVISKTCIQFLIEKISFEDINTEIPTAESDKINTISTLLQHMKSFISEVSSFLDNLTIDSEGPSLNHAYVVLNSKQTWGEFKNKFYDEIKCLIKKIEEIEEKGAIGLEHLAEKKFIINSFLYHNYYHLGQLRMMVEYITKPSRKNVEIIIEKQKIRIKTES
jgi:hypothetical protein